jgi:hypothetical protein
MQKEIAQYLNRLQVMKFSHNNPLRYTVLSWKGAACTEMHDLISSLWERSHCEYNPVFHTLNSGYASLKEDLSLALLQQRRKTVTHTIKMRNRDQH